MSYFTPEIIKGLIPTLFKNVDEYDLSFRLKTADGRNWYRCTSIHETYLGVVRAKWYEHALYDQVFNEWGLGNYFALNIWSSGKFSMKLETGVNHDVIKNNMASIVGPQRFYIEPVQNEISEHICKGVSHEQIDELLTVVAICSH